MKTACFAIVLSSTVAHADVDVSTGLALALADYETHGVAMPVRVAVDRALPGFRHRLRVAAEYAHFSRWFMRAPEVLPGQQLDVGTLRAAYRVFPYARRGLHVDAGAGVSVLHDRLAMALPDRRVESARTGVGVPLEIGVGWTIQKRVDLDVRYSHAIPIVGGSLAHVGIAIGVRL